MRTKLNGDAPATVDRLGFEQHATRIATGIADYVGARNDAAPSHGMVFSIEGPWGSGKSTYINLLRKHLEPYRGNNELVVVDFDPWWLSQKQNLVLSFFKSLVAVLPEKSKSRVARAMAHLATATKNIPDWVIDLTADDDGKLTRLGRFLRGAKESGGSLDSWLTRSVQLREARDRVARELAAAKRGLVVFVDDLDRLEGQDALAVLRFVKSVGDLSGVVYILAFSPDELHSALLETGLTKPEQFLEKIIQVSIPLPPPAKWRMRSMIVETLSAVLGLDAGFLGADVRVETVLVDAIAKPRDLARLSNNVAIVLAQVEKDVDLIDFACIHALRTLDPEFYRAVHLNKSVLTDSLSRGSSLAADVAHLMDDKNQARDRQRQALLLTGALATRRTAILKVLFPKCRLWDDLPTDEQLRELRTRRSVAIQDHFDTYFSLEVSPDMLSTAELDQLLSLSTHEARVSQLKSIAASDHGPALLGALLTFLSDGAPSYQAEKFLLAFQSALEPLEDRSKGAAWELATSASVLVSRLYREHASFRLEFVAAAANREALLVTGAFAWMVLRSSGELGQQESDASELRRLFGHVPASTEYGLLKAHFSRAMMNIANHGDLFSIPAAPRLIRVWMAWDAMTMRSWGRTTVSSESGFGRFLEAYAGYVITKDVIEAYFENRSTYELALKQASLRAEVRLSSLAMDRLDRMPKN